MNVADALFNFLLTLGNKLESCIMAHAVHALEDEEEKLLNDARAELVDDAENGNARRSESCCHCRDCDDCILKFAKFWLGCGCAQFGYSVIFWYLVNLGYDVYSLSQIGSSMLLLVLSAFNVLFVDVPVLLFTVCDQQYKLVFPFAANIAMSVISAIYTIYKLVTEEQGIDIVRIGFIELVPDSILYFLSALSLIPLFTYRLPLWHKTEVAQSVLYPSDFSL